MKGVIEYDSNGNPICAICGKSFKRVVAHVRQKHNMTEREYKVAFGLDLKKGICSQASSNISRTKTLANYDKCIANNLTVGGTANRFKEGSAGRTKEQVSEQTKLMLKARLQQPEMIAAMRESGKKVGKSGLGNKARWHKSA